MGHDFVVVAYKRDLSPLNNRLYIYNRGVPFLYFSPYYSRKKRDMLTIRLSHISFSKKNHSMCSYAFHSNVFRRNIYFSRSYGLLQFTREQIEAVKNVRVAQLNDPSCTFQRTSLFFCCNWDTRRRNIKSNITYLPHERHYIICVTNVPHANIISKEWALTEIYIFLK